MKVNYLNVLLCSLIVLLIGCTTLRPVNSNKTVYLTAPHNFEKEDEKRWDVLNFNIKYTDADVIVIDWTGEGGFMYMGDKTIKAMEVAKARGKTVIINLVGEAVSMHANVPCHASKIIWNGNILIFHGGFIRDDQGRKIYINDDSYFNYCTSHTPLAGILTQADTDAIMKDHRRVEVSPNHHQTLPDYP